MKIRAALCFICLTSWGLLIQAPAYSKGQKKARRSSGFTLEVQNSGSVNVSPKDKPEFALDFSKISAASPADFTLPSAIVRYQEKFDEAFNLSGFSVITQSDLKLQAVNAKLRSLLANPILQVNEGTNSTPVVSPATPFPLQFKKQYEVVATDQKKEALIRAYNDEATLHDDVTAAWMEMHRLRSSVYSLRNSVLELLCLAVDNSDYGDRWVPGKEKIKRLRTLARDLLRQSQTAPHNLLRREIAGWIWYTKAVTLNPFNVCDREACPELTDNALITQRIAQLDEQLKKQVITSEMLKQLWQRQYENHKLELTRLSSYTAQLAASDANLKELNPYRIISRVKMPQAADVFVFHDASAEFKVLNPDDAKQPITNEELISILICNIPPGRKLNYSIEDSVIKVLSLQFNNLIEPFLSGLSKGDPSKPVGTMAIPERAGGDTPYDPVTDLGAILDMLDAADQYLLPYLTYLPPARVISHTKATPVDKSYTTESREIAENEGHYSHKFKYTLYLGDGDEAKKEAKQFSIRTYGLHRMQFTGGVHFLTGHAPFVELKDNQFTVRSQDYTRFSVGLKYYVVRRQTFRDISVKEIPANMLQSIFVHLGFDVPKPLENFYPTLGCDIIPGLGIGIGTQLYRYNRFEVVNGAVVGEANRYKFRQGMTISLLMDAALITNIFGNFLKL